MKKFLVTYYDSIRKVEMSVDVRAQNLESLIAKEEDDMAIVNQSYPHFKIKSIIGDGEMRLWSVQ